MYCLQATRSLTDQVGQAPGGVGGGEDTGAVEGKSGAGTVHVGAGYRKHTMSTAQSRLPPMPVLPEHSSEDNVLDDA